jgi:hypothetical protein
MRASLLLLGGVLLLACTEIVTAPDVPVAIEIGPLPFPVVVAGDSLRDTTGAAVPVRVQTFDGRGLPIADVMVTYVVLDADPVAQLDPSTGRLLALRPGDVRVVALAGGLQSAVLTVPVVPRPTLLAPVGDLRDTIEYIDFRDHLSELRVRLLADTGQGPLAPVRRYPVDFRIVDPAGLPVGDSTQALMVNDQRRPSTRDTTGTDGVASRSLRLSPWIQRPPPDSVVVQVSVRHLDGTLVAGSPLRYVIIVQPVQAP